MPTYYPPPEKNPKCICPTIQAAFFCMTGHMLECHYPLTCAEAECDHWKLAMAAEAAALDDLERSDDADA